MLEANLWQPELVPPNNHFSGMGFSNAESGDSGITYSGLQYDSEASFESHRYKYQDSTKGVLTVYISSLVPGKQPVLTLAIFLLGIDVVPFLHHQQQLLSRLFFVKVELFVFFSLLCLCLTLT